MDLGLLIYLGLHEALFVLFFLGVGEFIGDFLTFLAGFLVFDLGSCFFFLLYRPGPSGGVPVLLEAKGSSPLDEILKELVTLLMLVEKVSFDDDYLLIML